MCKSVSPAAGYQAGACGWQWIKLKRDYRTELSDTVDLVVVGAFAGRGRRRGVYGALLLAAYDPAADVFRTVTKCGTGFSDADLAALPARLAPLARAGAARPGRRPPAARRLVRARAGAGDPQRRADPLPQLHRRLGADQRRCRAGHAVPAVHRPLARRQGRPDATTTEELVSLYRTAQRAHAAADGSSAGPLALYCRARHTASARRGAAPAARPKCFWQPGVASVRLFVIADEAGPSSTN